MSENTREEWLLSFTTDTDSHLFGEGIREVVMYTLDETCVPHCAWFGSAATARLGRAAVVAAGAWDVTLQHRTVFTSATEWVDVP